MNLNIKINIVERNQDIIIGQIKNTNNNSKSSFPPRRKRKLSLHQSNRTILDKKKSQDNIIINKNIKIDENQEKKMSSICVISKINFQDNSNIAPHSMEKIDKIDNLSIKEIKNNFNVNEKGIEILKLEKLSDYELNDLEYEEAIKLDKRTFVQIYFAIMKREHIILFTFFSCKDYNLLYIKLARFIFLISTDIALNVFFFSDESMHKLFLSYGKYNFLQQIPQIIYTTVISQILEVFLCFLSMTDKYIYQIKNSNMNEKQIVNILNCIKIKLLFFFLFTFAMFAFYWYTVSSFCAVYENSQTVFIKDSFSSFFLGIIYPFIIYLIPSSLRKCAIKSEKKRLRWVYKLSDIIPFF